VVVVVRLRRPAGDGSGPPARLFSTVVEDWVGPDEVPPPGWDGEEWMWRRVTAYRRRWQARIEWARQHGRPTSWSVKP
jgi:hypothetical protein